MEGSPVTLYRWDSMPKERLTDSLTRRWITGERVMLAQLDLLRGCMVPMHSHENEQVTYVLEGALRLVVGREEGEVVVVRAGEVLHIPSGVPHSAEALEDSLALDLFSPPRQDWLDSTDSYLREEPQKGSAAS